MLNLLILQKDYRFCINRCQFISLNLILPALAKILLMEGRWFALVKPQFEAGREQIGKNGIVRESSVHEKVLETVTAFAG